MIASTKQTWAGVALASALCVTLGGAALAASAHAAASYPRAAQIDKYFIADQKSEIALARSAAPKEISGNATILVLDEKGYHSAINGSNGFTCLVERAWMNPFDSPEFWNPKVRGPICYNPPAVRSILPYTIQRTTLVLSGISKAQMHDRITAMLARNELKNPEPGAMSYMMSKGGYLGDAVGRWYPHLMFHIRKTGSATWGANVDGSPVMANTRFSDMPEPETIFMIAVPHWSDGTSAPPGM